VAAKDRDDINTYFFQVNSWNFDVYGFNKAWYHVFHEHDKVNTWRSSHTKMHLSAAKIYNLSLLEGHNWF
jgi:hypothetical protein